MTRVIDRITQISGDFENDEADSVHDAIDLITALLVIQAFFVIDPPGRCLGADTANTTFWWTVLHGKAKITWGTA